jgi:glucosamine--fructose-6-phosphate aminotransferase (isomerizing)
MKSLGNFPDPFIAEITGQPDALRRAVAGLADQRAAFDGLAPLVGGRAIVLTGMGSSYDACYPAVAELARSGVAAVMLDAAELLHFRMDMLASVPVVVVVSQSGESIEVVRVVDSLRTRPQRPPTVIAVTNGTRNSLASLADRSIDTRAGEEVGPSTITFGASLVVVGALARALAGAAVDPMLERLTGEVELAAVSIEQLLDDGALVDGLVKWHDGRPAVVVLGRGPARAAAEMGALTIKEAVGIPIESLETAQFRHGPLELAGPDLAAAVIATEPETSAVDLALAGELAGAGANVLVVTAGRAETPSGTMQVTIGPLDRAVGPAVSIVPLQLLAWRLASLSGREPGSYRRAAKVTTHE